MGIPLRLLGLAAVTLIGATCAFPTDDSAKVFVSVVSLDTTQVVRRGEKLALYARMYHASGADTTEIQNVRFLWTSDDEDIATVEAGGLGSAEVTGVNSGMVNVNARAVAFEQAQSDQFAVRVSNPVEIDSIRPEVVRFGDTITVFGVGVDSIFFVQLGQATLFDYPLPGLVPTRTRDSLGFSTATFWVPAPAVTGQILYFGNGVFGLAPDSTRVFPVDVFEPNDTLPRTRSLDVARFPAPLQFIRFFNPALAFEPIKRDASFGVDWYRFTQGTQRDLTLIIQGAEVRGTFSTFLTDSLYWDGVDSTYYSGADAWTIGPSSHSCHGLPFEPAEVRPESTIVALRGMPAGAMHALAFYSQPGPYGLTVIEGYVASKAAFPRDNREEDDFCNPADLPARIVPVPLNGSWRDTTLTIDNPHDVDWIRFTVPDPGTGLAQNVVFRTVSKVAGDTTSDVDLYILTLPGAGLVEVASGQKVGSDESFSASLFPGDYYAVAVDYIGEPTRYGICIGHTFGACAIPAFPTPVTEPSAAAGIGAAPLKPKALRPSPVRTRRGTP